MYLDDYNLSSIIDFNFTTRNTNGLPTTLAGSPVVSVYKTNSTTQTTTGVTLTVDFDGITGLNHVRIDTSTDGSFYASGCDFSVVITIGTIGGSTVAGEVVAHFSILNRSALRPTTAGRTVLVASDGSISPNWADVKSPGTTVALTGTTLKSVYLARLGFQLGTTNKYRVKWFKDGIPQDSGVTSATIQVIKEDGTDLVASTAMTDAGNNDFRYTEATNVVTSGTTVRVRMTATIDSETRTTDADIGKV